MKKNKSSIGLIMISLLGITILSIIIYMLIGSYYVYMIEKNVSTGIIGTKTDDVFTITHLTNEKVVIPENMEKIELAMNYNSAFSITVNENNKNYYSKNNCVFEKETNNLILACVNSIIPKETKYISRQAFINITNSYLNPLYYEGSLEEWMQITFEDINPSAYFERVIFIDENGEEYEIEKVSFSDSTEIIPNYCFCNFKSLKEIEYNNVKVIGDYAFANCLALTELDIPNSVEKIGLAAFMGCNNLSKVSLPFIGEELDSTYDYFGHIFSENRSLDANRNIPMNIKEVIIKKENNVAMNAFNGCRFIESIVLNEEITSIGDKAFASCVALKKIVIPGKLDYFGWRVFDHTSIEEMYFNNSFDVFLGLYINNTQGQNQIACHNFYEYVNGEYQKVSKIYVDENIDSISSSLFGGFYFIEEVYFRANIKFIEDNSFASLINLKNVYYDGTIEDWLKIDFEDFSSNPMYSCENLYILDKNNCYVQFENIEIPSTITTIKSYAFVNCAKQSELIIPETVTTIEVYALYNIPNLKKLVIPFIGESSKVGSNLEYLFAIVPSTLKFLEITNAETINFKGFRFHSIETFVFGKNTKEFNGTLPFYNSNLKEVYYNNTFDSFMTLNMPKYCFYVSENRKINIYLLDNNHKYININDITAPIEVCIDDLEKILNFKNIKEINIYSTDNIIYAFPDISDISSGYDQFEIVRINEGTKTIKWKAFASFENLKEVYIPNSIEIIESGAFDNCSKLEKVEFAENSSLKTIPSTCFSECKELKEINIPDSVTFIDSSAFLNCAKLEKVNFTNNSKLETIGGKSFSNCDSLKELYIPISVKVIGYSAFDLCDEITLYCPYTEENCQYRANIDKENINVIWNYNN